MICLVPVAVLSTTDGPDLITGNADCLLRDFAFYMQTDD